MHSVGICNVVMFKMHSYRNQIHSRKLHNIGVMSAIRDNGSFAFQQQFTCAPEANTQLNVQLTFDDF